MILPNGSNRLPAPGGSRKGDYAELVAAALRTEFGDRRHTVKVIMRWTRASGRTVRYWLAAEAMPNGNHLIEMIARSDHVLETVLAASRRVDLLDLFIRMRAAPGASAQSPNAGRVAKRSPGRVPDVPDGPDGLDVPDGLDRTIGRGRPAETELNDRQLWFLERMGKEQRLDACALAIRFGVSERTAKRDIAGLKAASRISFVGNSRRGRYVPRR